jgi:ABC-type transport system substrate-binding protein
MKKTMNKILILSMVLFVILGCSISTTTPIYTATPLQIPKATSTVETSTLTPTVVNPTFICAVNVNALNIRSCESYNCNSVGSWSILNQRLLISKVSGDKNWFYSEEYKGWIRADYCTTIK